MDPGPFELQPTDFFAESDPLMTRPVDELQVSVRSLQILKTANIHSIGDLVQSTEADLLRTPQLGHKALKEINEALTSRGLALGSHVDD